ncbi:MAG: hypothetical protein ACPGPE_17030, partial [Planctomycetota bacterium]
MSTNEQQGGPTPAAVHPAGSEVQSTPGPAPLPARAPVSRHLTLVLVVALLVALDLWSKSAVFSWFQ